MDTLTDVALPDLAAIRSQFPALAGDTIYFDNAVGDNASRVAPPHASPHSEIQMNAVVLSIIRIPGAIATIAGAA